MGETSSDAGDASAMGRTSSEGVYRSGRGGVGALMLRASSLVVIRKVFLRRAILSGGTCFPCSVVTVALPSFLRSASIRMAASRSLPLKFFWTPHLRKRSSYILLLRTVNYTIVISLGPSDSYLASKP